MKLEIELKNAKAEIERLRETNGTYVKQALVWNKQNVELREEIKVQKEYAEALKRQSDSILHNLTLATRTIRIIKASVNGLVINGEDKDCECGKSVCGGIM